MIKDILVSLPIGRLSDSAVNYAVSVAEAFDAHLTGVAFVHEPFVPRTVFSGAATGFIAPYRAEVEKAAKASPRQGKGLMAPDVLPCLGISIMQPDAQPRRVSNSRHFMRFVPKTTPDMLKYITFQNDVVATHPAQVDRKMISVPTRH